MKTLPNRTVTQGNPPVLPSLGTVSLAVVLALCSNLGCGAEPEPVEKPDAGARATGLVPESSRKQVKLPGLMINLEERCVDVEGSVCLDEGTLELVACTKDSKEHESIVAIDAKPIHIHTALLLLGAKSGNPAMRKRIEGEQERWVDIPPRGGQVDLYLVFENKEGKKIERPISEFITRSGSELDSRDGDKAGADDAKFPTHTFLFAGSQLRVDGAGPRKYHCDLSGNVVSISTFGDELLCLPGVHGHANGALMWQVDATHLPAVGSKITLRLRPQGKPAPASGDEAASVRKDD